MSMLASGMETGFPAYLFASHESGNGSRRSPKPARKAVRPASDDGATRVSTAPPGRLDILHQDVWRAEDEERWDGLY